MNKINYFMYINDILYIYHITVDKYLNENTPCKECLINTTCLNGDKFVYGKNNLPIIEIKLCEQLKNFIENNNKYNNIACIEVHEIERN